MTYPTGGEQSPYRGTPDYPTTQFQAVRPDQGQGQGQGQYDRPVYDRPVYERDQYPREQYRDDRRDYEQSRYRDRDDYPDRRGGRHVPWGWLIPVAVLLVAAAAVGGYYFGHKQGKKDGQANSPKHFLSHTSVESYISQHFSAANVQCYGGQDMPLTPNSAFTCTAAGTSFVVIIKDPNTGSYQVLKAS